MNGQRELFVVHSARAEEIGRRLKADFSVVPLDDLASRDERFINALAFFSPQPGLADGVRRVLQANPSVHFILCHDEDVRAAELVQYVHAGVAETVSLADPAREWQALLGRFGPGGESELDYYHRLIARFRELGVLTNSLEMARIFSVVERVAPSNSTVLVHGESGTGKELIARAIHHFSPRRAHRFVAVNTGAIPENLLEDELFGHVRGAFTSALKDRKGKFEYADRGTIFLDEISNMPQSLQVKLLRVLQEREFERIGDNQTKRIDVRVISATNRNLEELVKSGSFREDLFYRLHVIPIQLPPLRQRRGDVPILANYFLAKYCQLNDLPPKSFVLPALRLLQGHSWPGNVRQLENLIERLVVLNMPKAVLLPADIPDEIKGAAAGQPGFLPAEIPDEGVSLNDIVAGVERTLILRSLEKSAWNKQKAAGMLGIKRTTLIEKMKKMQKQSE